MEKRIPTHFFIKQRAGWKVDQKFQGKHGYLYAHWQVNSLLCVNTIAILHYVILYIVQHFALKLLP